MYQVKVIGEHVRTQGQGFISTDTHEYEVSMNDRNRKRLNTMMSHSDVYINIDGDQAMIVGRIVMSEPVVLSIISRSELPPSEEVASTNPADEVVITEKKTLTFDLVQNVAEHKEFRLAPGDVLFEDKGLKIELVHPLIGGITGEYRVSYKETVIDVNGATVVDGKVISTVDIVSGDIAEVYRCVEDSGLQWCSMQEPDHKAYFIREDGVEAYMKDYVHEICEYMSDMFAFGVPMS